MSNEHLEQKIKQHFEQISAPDPAVREQSIRAVLAEASKVQALPKVKRSLLAPRFSRLILSQVRLTKGVVWILQACVVLVALVWIAYAGTYEVGAATHEEAGYSLAFTLASYGIASVFIAGISMSATVYGSNNSFIELSYSSHFDYRQVLLARMAVYGLGDVIALSMLIAFGTALVPLGFIEIILCSSLSFFTTCFVCMLLLTRFRGETGMVACLAGTLLIAVISAYAWGWHLYAMQSIAGVVWLVLLVGAVVGAGLCLRSFVSRIDAGFDAISQEER